MDIVDLISVVIAMEMWRQTILCLLLCWFTNLFNYPDP